MNCKSIELAKKFKLAGLLLPVAFCCLLAVSARAGSEADKMLKITTKQDKGGITHFFVHNNEAAEVTATFDVNMTNLSCSTNLPLTTTFAGNANVEVFSLVPLKVGEPWSFNYSDSFTIGDLNAVHDDNWIYQLPYKLGKTYRVTQGYHGEFSHTGADEYAIDWKMPIGTPVYAARGGVVVKAKDNSNVGGPDRKYEECANVLLIQHSDGTVGIYAHLKKGGIRVKVGDHVNTGDLVALSGNTGFTSGAHLHFSVFKTRSGHERLSIPVKFQTADGVMTELATDKKYKCVRAEVEMAKAPITQQASAQ